MTLHVALEGQTDLTGQIYRQVRRTILDGRLLPGDRLPPSRELARTLSVSRLTVTIVYERLAAEGFVRTAAGSGTFVSPAMARQKRDELPKTGAAVISSRPVWDTVTLPTAFDRPAIMISAPAYRTGHYFRIAAGAGLSGASSARRRNPRRSTDSLRAPPCSGRR